MNVHRIALTGLVLGAFGAASSLAAQADLTVAKLEFPATWKAGENVDYKVTVANIGSAIAISNKLGLYRSTNSVISKSDTLLVSRIVPVLAQNVSTILAGDLTASYKLVTQACWVGARVDDDQKVAELSESNNTKAVQVQCQARPRIEVTNLSVPVQLKARNGYSVTATIKNTGGAAAGAFRVGLVASTNNVITRFDNSVRSFYVPSLAVDATRNILIKNSSSQLWPVSITGQHYVGVVADIGEDLDQAGNPSMPGLLRNIAEHDGPGAYIAFSSPRYGATSGDQSPWYARFNTNSGTAPISIRAPGLPFHGYVLVWSASSQQVTIDAFTELGLQLLGSPMLLGYVGKADGFGQANASFKMPAGINASVNFYTHSVWFDPSFVNFVGFGSNSVRMQVN